MLLRLLLLLTVVPLVELVLLLWLASETGWLLTVLLVLATGVVGAFLARHEGLRCMQRAQRQAAEGQLPGDALLDAVMILVAGVLLITPGMLTDLFGFALLLPPFRRVVKRRIKYRFEARLRVFTPDGRPPPTGEPPPRDKIIDVQIVDESPEQRSNDE